MDKGGHYDMQMKRWTEKGYYDVQIVSVDGKGGHYVEIKGWFQSLHYDVQIKRAERQEGIMMWK